MEIYQSLVCGMGAGTEFWRRQVLIDAIVWAIKHRERNIADAGLTILLEMLRNLDGAGEVRLAFHSNAISNCRAREILCRQGLPQRGMGRVGGRCLLIGRRRQYRRPMRPGSVSLAGPRS
jgi:hypothetical protein